MDLWTHLWIVKDCVSRSAQVMTLTLAGDNDPKAATWILHLEQCQQVYQWTYQFRYSSPHRQKSVSHIVLWKHCLLNLKHQASLWHKVWKSFRAGPCIYLSLTRINTSLHMQPLLLGPMYVSMKQHPQTWCDFAVLLNKMRNAAWGLHCSTDLFTMEACT